MLSSIPLFFFSTEQIDDDAQGQFSVARSTHLSDRHALSCQQRHRALTELPATCLRDGWTGYHAWRS